MRFYFDESGDYAFPGDRFDCYVQAVLICPDSRMESCAKFVQAYKDALSISELHGCELGADQLLEVARLIEASSCQLLAHLPDTVLVTREQIAQFRLDQAAIIKRGLDWYRRESTKARGEPASEIEQWMLRLIKRAGLASKISHGEFLQAHYLVELIAAALQKAIFVFHENGWRDDWRELDFIIDGKLPAKMAAGERYLNDTLVPALGSRRGFTLTLPDIWQADPKHPFVARCERAHGRVRGAETKGAIDLKAIFARGLQFEDSAGDPGLQLVDVVANLIRRAVLQPDDATVQHAFDAIRPKLRTLTGQSLTLQRLRVGEIGTSSTERYRRLYGPARS
jgi:hypothetical protein